MVLLIATSQFPVAGSPRENFEHIRAQIIEAAGSGARVVHFPEAALSGYAGVDLASFDQYPWDELRELTVAVCDLARSYGIWVLLGSAHRLADAHKPRNSMYIVDDTGNVVDRYDKRFCAGNADETEGDLRHYSSGDHFSVFTIDGVTCSALVCHDYRYPELYRQLAAASTQVVFHAFHAGHLADTWLRAHNEYVGDANVELNGGSENANIPAITMRASMIAAAAANHVHISCSNSSRAFSAWGAFSVRADGVVTGGLRRHEAGLLFTTIDTTAELYDSTAPWRARTIGGTLHTGTLVEDARSLDRKSL